MIVSVDFRRFKALREARVTLQPFNLVVGPNGSGKTSLIQSLLRLRTLSRLNGETKPPSEFHGRGPVIEFRFTAPHETAVARLSCASEMICDQVEFLGVDPAGLASLKHRINGIRAYLFDHYAMAESATLTDSLDLASNGANLSVVLANLQRYHPESFERLQAEVLRLMPEFAAMEFRHAGATVQLALKLSDASGLVTADNVSQGTLYALAMLFLAFHPAPPAIVCIEEIDRGIHPRMLREVRDMLYRLSYPADFQEDRPPAQVIATTHSPYLLDLFKDHPEEVIISQKHGTSAHFERLSDREDLADLLREGPLGDIWFSGILGGVPEE
ncbi:MAG: AAA family ATPase [Opitutaceae bacterium]|nr:AAA family ATPase [Opitutaceae bacterium]